MPDTICDNGNGIPTDVMCPAGPAGVIHPAICPGGFPPLCMDEWLCRCDYCGYKVDYDGEFPDSAEEEEAEDDLEDLRCAIVS